MKQSKLYLALALVVVIAAAAVIIIQSQMTGDTSTNQTQTRAQNIPAGSSFDKVQQLSAGSKPACLTPDSALEDTEKADEALPFDKSMSAALGTVITDMPAGYTTVKLHTYTATSATGYEVFSDKNQKAFAGNLNTFNFKIERSSAEAGWELSSFVACAN